MFEKEFHFFMKAMYYSKIIDDIIIAVVLSCIVIWVGGHFLKVKNLYKTIATVIAIILSILIVSIPYKREIEQAKAKKIAKYNERKAKYEAAKAVFDEQCKKAGEKIYRTVDNVDGVMLLRVGETDYVGIDAGYWNESFEHAVMGGRKLKYKEGSYQVEYYIKSFLNYLMTSSSGYRDSNGVYHPDYYWTNMGYQYVDVFKKNSLNKEYINGNSIIRYVRKEPKHITSNLEEKEFNPDNPARYAVSYENNIDISLRKHWIAGTTIKIIDRETDELLAEKIAFAFDPYLGGITDRGQPWEPNRTVACSNEERFGTDFVKNFAIKVLKPIQLTTSFNGGTK